MGSNIRQSLVLAAAVAALPLRAQLTSPLCPGNALAATDFNAVELFNKTGSGGAAADPELSEPTKADMLVVNDAGGQYSHTNIIFTERTGNVKWYDGAAKKVTLMGKINVHAAQGSSDDNGLMGVVFHPAFEKNRWIYLWYSPKETFNQAMTGSGQNRQLRLARFTVTPDNKLDMASEKNLLKILGSKSDQWHSGGPMEFDAYGDLWVAIGNNGPDLNQDQCSAGNNVLSKTDSTVSAEWGSSNTANFRGSFLRIHPDSTEKGYSIPAGNFGEYWADQFEKQGNKPLADEYRNPKKVLPEIYVKGERSNYSITVHPTKRWLAWGTVNFASNLDEFNITDRPIFTGFPYFHAANVATCNHGKSVEAPTNTSPLNSGVTTLPPAIGGTINNLINVAIGGPIYSFNPSLNNKFKFPPHFDEKWLVSGFGRQGSPDIWAVTIDTTKDPFKTLNTTALRANIFKNVPVRNFIGAKFGKDGALYITNYDGDYGVSRNPGVVRVTYQGTCSVVSNAPQKRIAPYQKIWIDPQGIMVGEKGRHAVSLYDLTGQRVWSREGSGPQLYRTAEIQAQGTLKAGVYMAKVATPAGEVSRRISLF